MAEERDVHRVSAEARMQPDKSMAALAMKGPTVDMVLLRPCNVALPDHSSVSLGVGLKEFPAIVAVPESIADHPYLKQCGAKRKEA